MQSAGDIGRALHAIAAQHYTGEGTVDDSVHHSRDKSHAPNSAQRRVDQAGGSVGKALHKLMVDPDSEDPYVLAVTNISTRVKESILLREFKKHGRVFGIEMSATRGDNAKNARVVFADSTQAAAAVASLNGKTMAGRSISVVLQSSDDQVRMF